jgi:hypothetical protein
VQLQALAAAVGAGTAALAVVTNAVRTWDEALLWLVAGSVGGPLAVGFWSLAGVPAAVGLWIFAVAGLLGAILCPALDGSDRRTAWGASCAVTAVQAPLTAVAGLLGAVATRVRRRRVVLQKGTVFVEVLRGAGAVTLGPVAWAQSRQWRGARGVSDRLARHEAVHRRAVAATGELGFYLTYVTLGALWARCDRGPWNGLDPRTGLGNPLEKAAHAHTGDPAVAVPSRLRRRG